MHTDQTTESIGPSTPNPLAPWPSRWSRWYSSLGYLLQGDGGIGPAPFDHGEGGIGPAPFIHGDGGIGPAPLAKTTCPEAFAVARLRNPIAPASTSSTSTTTVNLILMHPPRS